MLRKHIEEGKETPPNPHVLNVEGQGTYKRCVEEKINRRGQGKVLLLVSVPDVRRGDIQKANADTSSIRMELL